MSKKEKKLEQEEVVEVEVAVETVAEAPKSKLPSREAVLEGRKHVFVQCPDGCEYDVDDVPLQFQHLL